MALALIYVMLGLGLNIVVGFAGLLDLGYVGFYAVGAYTYACATSTSACRSGRRAAGGAASALFGFLLASRCCACAATTWPSSLGFGEIIRLLLNNLTSLTGGPDGISGIPKPTVFGLVMARSLSPRRHHLPPVVRPDLPGCTW
jgi:branched-chain amino acid transport system permease protein